MKTTSVIPPPEYRRCPATGRWVILAPERSLRPMTLKHAAPHHGHEIKPQGCPFCPGSEHLTTSELYALRPTGSSKDSPGWQLRVVANKFPAVKATIAHSQIHNLDEGGLFEAVGGYGWHEVVIETAEHLVNPIKMTVEQFCAVWVSYKERLIAHARHPDLVYSMVFKNVGAEAGASLAHSHSQIVATPIVPDALRSEFEEANNYYSREKRCVYCDMLARERVAGTRIACASRAGHFVAICPFAPRFAYEVWVLPVVHDSRFEACSAAQLQDLAELMHRVLSALDVVLAEPPYNYYLHTGPLRAPNMPYYHWHVEIAPRTDRQAGYEWGSGCFINAVPPELAAARLWDSGPLTAE